MFSINGVAVGLEKGSLSLKLLVSANTKVVSTVAKVSLNGMS